MYAGQTHQTRISHCMINRKPPVKRATVIYTLDIPQLQLRAIKAERNVLPKVPTIRSTKVTPHSCEWMKEDIETILWTITSLFLVKIESRPEVLQNEFVPSVSASGSHCSHSSLFWPVFWYLCFLCLFLCLFPLCHSPPCPHPEHVLPPTHATAKLVMFLALILYSPRGAKYHAIMSNWNNQLHC